MATHHRLDSIVTSMEEADDRRLSPNYFLLRYRIKSLLPRLKGSRVLELGCAEGGMTKALVECFPRVVIVEGSQVLLKRARQNVKARNATFCCSFFEDFEPDGTFSSIIMSHIIEHLDNPIAFLKRASKWLAPKGLIHIIVPNAEALNRRIGKEMGMLKRLDELHERDRRVGHLRVYSRKTLFTDIKAAGLKIVHWDGIFLKPLSDAQMQGWDEKLLDAFFEVGRELPEYCSEIYVECTPKEAK